MDQNSRGGFRGGARGAYRGRGGGAGGRGGGPGGHGSAGRTGGPIAGGPSKEAGVRQLVNLGKYLDKTIKVKFAGGKEVNGELKGYDQLLNVVLDNAEQIMKSTDGSTEDKVRQLGLVVVRGTSVALISPLDGTEEIPNPFTQSTE